jgi:ATP-dependent RNA helicase DOB1
VTAKGRCAAEINSVNEIVMTELLFSGLFNELNEAQTVALLTAMLLQEKADDAPPVIREEMVVPLKRLRETAERVRDMYRNCRMEDMGEDVVEAIKPALVELGYRWTEGATFAEVKQLTPIFEGSIVRCLRRVDELLQELTLAAAAMRSEQLVQKFTKCSTLIKRDIVFAASLYLSQDDDGTLTV